MQQSDGLFAKVKLLLWLRAGYTNVTYKLSNK